MQLGWFAVSAIKPEGETYVISDPSVWEEALVEFNMNDQISNDLKAEVWVLPQDEGCYARGQITGTINLACNRCAEPVQLSIDHAFENFEPFPLGHAKRLNDIAPGKTHDKGRKRTENKHERLLQEVNSREEVDIDADVDEAVMRLSPDGHGPEINIAALLWEELVLALPVKVLCSKDCKGLCPECGENLNFNVCPCNKQGLDPRLAALRDLKIEKS